MLSHKQHNKSNKTVKISPFPPFLFIQPNNVRDRDRRSPNDTSLFLPLFTTIVKEDKKHPCLHHIIRPHTLAYRQLRRKRTNNIIKGENKSEKSYINAIQAPLYAST